MSNSFSGFGRIIKFDHKVIGEGKSILSVNVSVNTGEQKKEGDAYPPSNIIKLTIWNKRADALIKFVEEGMHVYFTGKMGVPYSYVTEGGEPRTTLQVHSVDEFNVVRLAKREDDNGANASTTTKATAPKESSTKLPVPEDEEGDILPF